MRSAHSPSCSAAAARNVSAAARTTSRPSRCSTAASLPMVVVLPVPLTPVTIQTVGSSSWVRARLRSAVPRALRSSCLSRSTTSSAVVAPSSRARRRSSSTISMVAVTPTSAVISASSRPSQASSVDAPPEQLGDRGPEDVARPGEPNTEPLPQAERRGLLDLRRRGGFRLGRGAPAGGASTTSGSRSSVAVPPWPSGSGWVSPPRPDRRLPTTSPATSATTSTPTMTTSRKVSMQRAPGSMTAARR